MAPGQDAKHKKGARSTGNRFMDLDKDADMNVSVGVDGEVPLLLVIPFVRRDNGDLCTVSSPLLALLCPPCHPCNAPMIMGHCQYRCSMWTPDF